ncbi:hypothetical protein SEA_BENCZKOWSKI14_13 [Gordonia phage Benczkowski14]|uniref:Uncharacterized protein n=5 Tax=Demosthenesvirus katyusha TaxID=1982108 RepID=A0A345MCE8_9CAUD|nr:hypothetical protein BH765_gp13 [Gordonia phage Kvothe]YP_009603287.1 hypothetical protein FDH67_gp13 [Gordonia phage Katyusha]AMS03723.1 hypothetical protein SEA_BENCZKOWSKI14_13 [Gordonia phage Benczkowski14]AXH68169.1 hypothetical protein SEA_TEATEALATTE_13 [Gordonia phage Teatealatte]QBP29571.1 hypothetical protein SEA_TREDGE_13 [Gordonia phage Tredge]UJD20651.1 hypothetical protein SEA_NIAGARA_13 [Gordonia phage Niagara]UYL87034.1 hypothetical protein SEA_HOLLOW_13 [Gordonia phage Hol
MSTTATQHELRCDCSSHRLLAHYGVDENGKLYVLVASFRNRKPTTKIFSNHSMKIFCPSCERWFSVVINNQEISKQEMRLPPALPGERVMKRVVLDNGKPRL